MEFECIEGFEKSRLKSLLDHLGEIDDPRDPWRVMHPLREILFLVVCGTICDCEDYELIADWGEERIDFLRRYLPYEHGVPCGRWLTILMNRIEPALFAAAFTAWVREAWPDKADFVAIDGKTLRRSHDHTGGKHALHLVSAYATTGRLVLGQEAVPDKANEISAIPALIERLGANGGMSGVIDARGHVLAALPLGARTHLDVVLPPPLPPPLYARLGDGLLLALAALLLALGRIGRDAGMAPPPARC